MNTLQTLHKNNTTVAKSLSDQYAPVNTDLLLSPFLTKGWSIVKHTARGLGKEQITLKHNDYVYSNGDFLTIECLNSFDGSAALNLLGGYGRLVCANGLVIGDLEHGRFIHRGTKIYEKLENKYAEIVAHLDDIRRKVDVLKNATLDDTQLNKVIEGILKDVFEKDTKKYSSVVDFNTRDIDRLKRVRRVDDTAKDSFTLLNVVQENVIRYGLLGCTVTTTDKETNEVERAYKSKNKMENSINSVKMNKLITENFLKMVA